MLLVIVSFTSLSKVTSINSYCDDYKEGYVDLYSPEHPENVDDEVAKTKYSDGLEHIKEYRVSHNYEIYRNLSKTGLCIIMFSALGAFISWRQPFLAFLAFVGLLSLFLF